MTGKTVVLYAAPEFLDPEVGNNVTDVFNQSSGGETSFYTPVQVATAVTFMVGFIQVEKMTLFFCSYQANFVE